MDNFKVECLVASFERTIRRLWILCIILIILLAGTNAAWIYYESQFEVVEETTTTQDVSQDSEDGNNTFVGGDYSGSTDN